MTLSKSIASFAIATLIPSGIAAASDKNPVVVMQTNHGDITIELDSENAPVSTQNFLKYVKSGFYDQTVFHRVISNFMIQGGGFAKTEDGIEQKEGYPPIKNEAKNGLKNVRGSVAMARTNDPHSASSQFFINVVDNENLDHPSFDGWGYAVFGKVVDGMDVVDKIRAVPTTVRKLKARLPNGSLYPNDFRDVPVDDVVIKNVSLKEAGKDTEEAADTPNTTPASGDEEAAGQDESGTSSPGSTPSGN